MAYTRPAAPLEVNANNTLMPNPIIWAFGTNGGLVPFGRHSLTMFREGDQSKFAENTTNERITQNNSTAWLKNASNNETGMRTEVFTRVFAFYVPATLPARDILWISGSEDSGGGYNNHSMMLYIEPDMSVHVDRSNIAAMLTITGQITPGAMNTICLTRHADKSAHISVNANPAQLVPIQDYWFGQGEMFGLHQYVGEAVAGLDLAFYAQSQTDVSAANCQVLSSNPAQVARTVGTSGLDTPPPATDTTPPSLVSLGSSADGTQILLSANEALKNQVPSNAALSISNGHTVTGITISGQIATATITPALAIGETGVTASYSASSSGFTDVAGNQLPSFTAQAVTNNVGAAFWKFLGNEGQTVTVPANTRVRYGVEGKYVEQTKSGSFTIDNATFTDPAPGSIKHADSFVNGVATGYSLSGPAIGPVGESSPFTVQVDGLIGGDMVVTPAATGLTFSPPSVILNNNNMTATFSAISTAAGDFSITLTNNKNFSNPAAAAYKSITSVFKTFGTAGDYATLDAAIAAVGQTDPAGAKIMVVLEGLSDQASVNSTVNPTSANESFYYLIRPKKELQFGELNRAGALHESMSGATINLPSNQFNIGGGVVLEGWKINITGYQALKMGKGGAGPEPTLRRCFVIANGDQAITNEAYKAAKLEDSFFLRTTANAGKLFNAPWVLKIDRCTFYNKGGNAAVKAHDGGWGNGAYIKNSAYVGFGADPIDQIGGFTRLNNVSTSGMADSGGFTVDTVNSAFISGTNYRAGPALEGKAGVDAKSVNDVLGNNRGTRPDVGAAQGTAATPLAAGVYTSQPDPDGSRVTGFFTYTGTVTSATVSLVALADGQSIGPLDITVSGGTGSFQIDDVVPGSYAEPNVQLINQGGPSKVAGGVPFEINGVGAGPVDPGTQAAATSVVVNGPTSGLAGAPSTAFSVGLNGSYSGTVRVTPSDGGSGTFNPAYVDLVNGGAGSFTYTPTGTGTKSITLSNDKGLQNPNAAPYVVTAPQVIVPKIVLPLTTDGTAPVANMAGLQYAWFDQSLPQNFTAPKLKGNNGVIDSGSFTLILDGSTLLAGATGYLILTNTNGDVAQSPAALVFAGSVKVQ